jgi:hypothetical protein
MPALTGLAPGTFPEKRRCQPACTQKKRAPVSTGMTAGSLIHSSAQ